MALFRRNRATAGDPAQPQSGFASLRSRLTRTRAVIAHGLRRLFVRNEPVDAAALEQLEEALLAADVGARVASDISRRVRDAIHATPEKDPLQLVRAEMLRLLAPVDIKLHIAPQDTPYVVLMVGVNGVGKTTTAAKLGQRLQGAGLSVMFAAADTFRAAAVDQLREWGQRLAIPVIAQDPGADPAAVAHDALFAARARRIDVLIVDTAGRQHTHGDLMQQLDKIRRVLCRLDPAAPHEVLLVLDAGTGQNALVQAERFRAAVNVTGLCLTKLDGTARGGILLAIAERFGLPVRFIGVGEQAEDLRDFDASEFVDALLPDSQADDRDPLAA